MYCRCAEHSAALCRQRGVALITVMLVFVLATMMATQMLRTSYLAIHRTGNLLDTVQARYYALGAEEMGRQILAADGKSTTGGKAIDHLGEQWAGKGLSFEIEEESDEEEGVEEAPPAGKLEIEIADMAGRFNVNSLADAKGKADPAALARFTRLLRQFSIEPAVAEAAADWVDADDSTGRGGSERAAWGLGDMPNQPMVEVGELRALPGIGAEAWAALAPHLSALPAETKLNINTASAEVLLVFADVDKATASLMERFVHAREQQPIRDANAASQLFSGAVERIDVKSDFFAVRAHAVYRNRHARLETLMQRDARTGKVAILARSDASKL